MNASHVVLHTSCTFMSHQSYHQVAPVVPSSQSSRTSRTVKSHQSYRQVNQIAPVLPSSRTSRTIKSHQSYHQVAPSYHQVVPVVPSSRTSRTIKSHQSYRQVAPVVPSSRTSVPTGRPDKKQSKKACSRALLLSLAKAKPKASFARRVRASLQATRETNSWCHRPQTAATFAMLSTAKAAKDNVDEFMCAECVVALDSTAHVSITPMWEAVASQMQRQPPRTRSDKQTWGSTTLPQPRSSECCIYFAANLDRQISSRGSRGYKPAIQLHG